MKLTLDSRPPAQIDTECLVLSITDGGELSPSTRQIDEASDGSITRLIESGDIRCSLGKTTMLHQVEGIAANRVLFVGLGKPTKLNRAKFDRACLIAGDTLKNLSLQECHVCMHESNVPDSTPDWCLRQSALAVYRANYLYTLTKKQKDDAPSPLESASFPGDESSQSLIDQAEAFGLGFVTARKLGDLPPNICNPTYLAKEAEDIAGRYANVKLKVLEEDEMAELGMNSLLGVSQGSATPAKLIVLNYQGAAEDEQPTIFVGKGITFDSGGLSLKSGENMMQMKYDMCGAAGVLGAFVSCVRLQLPINVICIVAAVENMPDGNAYRPGDVLTSMSGQTIEVLNTDAEGRLVLCDALTYSQQFNPRVVIDAATLTGACVIALGHHASGLLSNSDTLANDLLAAGDNVVDRAWRLPLWDDYQSQLDTPFADMKNVGGMSAGAVTAGCFLSRFMKETDWAHLDVAGSAWKWASDDGATGRPVGLLAQYLVDQSGVGSA